MSTTSEPTTPHFFEMPTIPPKRGEMWLSVELSAVSDRPIADVLQTLLDMDYKPELRYRQNADRIALFALLKHEHMINYLTTICSMI